MAETWHPVRWLAYATGAVTSFWALRSVGALVEQVQHSGSERFGGMEQVGRGLWWGPAIERTRPLLETWATAGDTVGVTATVYTVADLLLIACYTLLLTGIVRWLRSVPEAGHVTWRARWALFRRIATSRAAPWLPVAAAVADLAENGVRLLLIHAGPADWLIVAAWLATTAKFVLLGLSVAAVLLLICDRGLARRAARRNLRWALWRLRVPAGVTLVLAGLVLGDPTGQAADLIRRWLDSWPDAIVGASAVAGAALLGLAGWLITRRVVLADQAMDDASRRRHAHAMWFVWPAVGLVSAVVAVAALDWEIRGAPLGILVLAVALLAAAVAAPRPGRTSDHVAVRVATDWRTVLLVATIAAWTVAAAAGWPELRGPATVGTAVLVLEALAFLGERRSPAGADGGRSAEATGRRMQDLHRPARDRARAARRVARLTAVAAPVAVLVAAAGALAPVPVVLWLSGDRTSRFGWALTAAVVAAAAPAAVAVAGYAGLRALDRRSAAGPLEQRYRIAAPAIVLGAALGLIGGAAHWPGIGPISVVAAFLATAVIALGEAQLWSETRPAPRGLLLADFTRVPPVLLLVLCGMLAASHGTGSGHAVFRSGTVPAPLAGSPSPSNDVVLRAAFDAWVRHNCAGPGRAGSVPLILVSAPGGGLRAAYWTASTLTDLFGATAAPSGGCAGAAPSDLVFAVGGASGGSFGTLAWIGGLGATPGREASWYDTQLAGPDFLSDPLAWLLTVDFSRSYLGFAGQDRARRLENRWSQEIPGMSDGFFAGSWGLGGTRPLPLLTGTQVETGCRLNVGALRVTDPAVHAGESGCATVHEGRGQTDAPATSDLLDHLCGPEPGSGRTGVSRSTAALLSARFPWVSPSGQLYRCSESATRISVVDGGYADNTGMGLLLDVWPRLSGFVEEHNADPSRARIVPVFLEVDNHYAAVAAPAAPGRTVETLVPPLTRGRPDRLDDLVMRARAAAAFAGSFPGTPRSCHVDRVAGRYVRISPKISPGLPAPLAWTLSATATADLRRQRANALAEPGPAALRRWVAGEAPAGC